VRVLIAYGREFTRTRPYRLEDLVRAAGPAAGWTGSLVCREIVVVGLGCPGKPKAAYEWVWCRSRAARAARGRDPAAERSGRLARRPLSRCSLSEVMSHYL
jgi:hypothetical protein